GDWAEDFGANAVLRGKPRSGDPAYPRAVTNDFVRFVFDLDAKYWRTMGECLKKSLGVKCIVIGTLVGSSTPYFQDDGFLDAADEHLYWSHPDAISSNPCSWLCVQTAEVNFPEDGIYKATQRIAGMPFTMTETSEPFPSLFGAEHLPMMHAYGAFQGWAGVFAYTWNHTSASLPNHHEYFFSHAGRPDTQAHFPACAAITLGKAVAPAKERITVPAPESEYVERVVDKRRIILLANEALPKGADCWNECLRHGIAVDLTAAAPRPKVEPQPADKRWRSDTGELLWDVSVASNGFVTLDTKDVKFFTGFVHGRKFDFGGARLEIGKTRFDFATVTMFSKDRTGFGADGKPARLLVAATGIAKNSGQVYEVVEGLKGAWHDPDGIWTASHQGKWGRGPALVEGVPATLTLKAKSSAVKCWALDGHGRRTTEVPVVSTADGNAQLALDARYRTLWYEVKVN
ncbi:MAG TPA: hypothetical protein PKI32_05305, partial [Opitutales bacterium]|nr:hypothetical protein [Opitutales bacterium]